MASRKRGGIPTLVIAAIFVAVGAWAYTHNMHLVLFRFIPLNAYAFAAIAAVLVVVGIVQLVRPASDQPGQPQENPEQKFQRYLEQAGRLAASYQPMPSPAVVNIADLSGRLNGGARAVIGLNGYLMGELAAQGVLAVQTSTVQNILTVQNSVDGTVINAPFTAYPGVQISLVLVTDTGGKLAVDQR
ncbi:MAG: hypothetical protein LBJ62_05480 [Bifidobacteriaceae bacterium]|jgi:hypothetical protein|nr:hypothetical protein [Bifidobacteriaceae bacterium]